jgi:hypothetical protein
VVSVAKEDKFVNGHDVVRSTSIPSLSSESPSSSTLTLDDVNKIRDAIKESFSPRFDAIDQQNISFQTQLTRISQEQLNLSNHMVGWDRCASIRSDADRKVDQLFRVERTSNGEKFKKYDDQFNAVFQKLDEHDKICTEFQTVKGGVVTDAALARAEGRVVEKAVEKAEKGDDGVLEEVKALRKDFSDYKIEVNNKLSWMDVSGGYFKFLVSHYKAVLVVLGVLILAIMIAFVPVDFGVRNFQWTHFPPANVTVGGK